MCVELSRPSGGTPLYQREMYREGLSSGGDSGRPQYSPRGAHHPNWPCSPAPRHPIRLNLAPLCARIHPPARTAPQPPNEAGVYSTRPGASTPLIVAGSSTSPPSAPGPVGRWSSAAPDHNADMDSRALHIRLRAVPRQPRQWPRGCTPASAVGTGWPEIRSGAPASAPPARRTAGSDARIPRPPGTGLSADHHPGSPCSAGGPRSRRPTGSGHW